MEIYESKGFVPYELLSKEEKEEVIREFHNFGMDMIVKCSFIRNVTGKWGMKCKDFLKDTFHT